MEKEFSFLIYKIIQLHSEDPAHTRYYNILQALLEIDDSQTLDFIESLEDDEDLSIISAHFGPLSGKFQSLHFVEKIQNKVERMKFSKLYEFIKYGVTEASKAMDLPEQNGLM